MLDRNTNFKLTKTGGRTRNSRKPPKYFIDFKNQMLDFVKEQRAINKQVLDFMKFVTNQFQKHGWTK